MELITSQIEKIEDLLAKMDEIIDTARSAPFSANVKIDRFRGKGRIEGKRQILSINTPVPCTTLSVNKSAILTKDE